MLRGQKLCQACFPPQQWNEDLGLNNMPAKNKDSMKKSKRKSEYTLRQIKMEQNFPKSMECNKSKF